MVNVGLYLDKEMVEKSSRLVGPEEFESSSIAPEATSLDQASRRPLNSLFLQGVFGEFLH
jgi:hypothetical protein